MSTVSSSPRRHHLVPQFYLRRFANAHDKIMVSRRDLQKRFLTSVERAARETDFYTVETTEGSSQLVEQILSRVETLAAQSIERLVAGGFPPTQEDRENVAVFIALQLTRGRDHRHAWNVVADAFLKLSLEGMTEAGVRQALTSAYGRPPTKEEVASAYELVENPESYFVVPHQNESIEAMLDNLQFLVPPILERTWKIAEFDKPLLLTSDSPVVLWSPRDQNRELRGIGLLTAKHIRFPLDPWHALILVKGTEGRERMHFIDERHSLEMNWGTAARAYEWIYHHPEQDPLAGLEPLPAPRPPLRISGRAQWFGQAGTAS